MVIGIIGGGQLGMFLVSTAYRMGHKTIVYDENSDCCAAAIANEFIQGKFDDYDMLENFMKKCDVVTYEFENVNSKIIAELSTKYNIPQKATPLILASSRFKEREMADKLNINQPQWQYVNKVSDLKLEFPYILKTDTLGYDGKGQYHINNESDLNNMIFDKTYYLAEKKIKFDYEISIIAVRSLSNEMVIYPLFYNIHQDGILKITLIDIEINKSIEYQAQNIITRIMEDNNIYGILCCEFLVKDSQLFFNEMAPRPHNSGHITMDTHVISQYENHLRAIMGMPLGQTNIKSNGFMVNVLGQDYHRVRQVFDKYPKVIKYYDYHKTIKNNRKVGHLVCFDNSLIQYFKKEWFKLGVEYEK